MRVLHIINSLRTGGAEKLLVDSLPLYKDSNTHVDLLILDATETPFLKKLKITFCGKIYFSKIKNIYSPLQILQIQKYLKAYDIVHGHLFPVVYWLSIAKLLSNSRTKIVFTEHSTNNKRLRNKIFRQVDKVFYKPYHKITAITPQVKEVLVRKLNIPEKKIEVIYNGIDTKRYEDATPYDKSAFFNRNNIILIQVSRFQIQKDQKTLIRAMSLLSEQYKLLLVGDGEFRVECEELVSELGLYNRILFLGERMDVPELLKTSDIVVQSSHWEGFGLSIIEGMAAGLPAVASDVEGLRELVKNYGFLFEAGSAESLAEKINLLSDKYIYREMAEKCLQRAKEFHILEMIKRNVKLYNRLLNNNKNEN